MSGATSRPESVLRRVHGERAVGLNYGQRALMFGAAHPVNFIGTQASTRSGARPFLRLAHTAKVFETIFLAPGPRRTRRWPSSTAAPAGIGEMPYAPAAAGRDRLLRLRPAADAVDRGGDRRLGRGPLRHLVRRLSPAEQGGALARLPAFRRALRDAAPSAPATYGDFRAYWEEIWTGGELHLTDEARAVGLAIAFEIPMPRYLHPSPRGPQPGPRRHAAGARARAVRDPLVAGRRGRLPVGGRRPAHRPPGDPEAHPPRRQHRLVRRWSPGPRATRRRGPRDPAVAGRGSAGPISAHRRRADPRVVD